MPTSVFLPYLAPISLTKLIYNEKIERAMSIKYLFFESYVFFVFCYRFHSEIVNMLFFLEKPGKSFPVKRIENIIIRNGGRIGQSSLTGASPGHS